MGHPAFPLFVTNRIYKIEVLSFVGLPKMVFLTLHESLRDIFSQKKLLK